MIKKFQVYATIAISLLFAVLSPTLFPNLMIFWIVLAFLIVLSIASKNWVDLILLSFVLLNILLHQLLYPNLDDTRHIVQATAFTAFTLLQITLVIGPLTRINKRFSPLFKHRRHVGVSAFLLAFIHANFVIARYYDFNPKLIYSITANYFGSTALIILSALAFTSTNYFQTKLSTKYYNIMHTALLLFYIAYTFGMSAVGILDLDAFHYVIFAGFVMFWVLIAPWSLPKKLFLRVNAWKQLHYLVYIAYLSIIFHAWSGYFILQPLPMQATFWISTTVVFLIHIYGWFIRLKKNKTPKLNTPPLDSQ